MKRFLILFLFTANLANGQGLNHQWLLGYWNINDPKCRILVNNNSYSLITENRKMPFWGTEANISDSNGNLLMSSNGIWIANATGDTMVNGSGLNPGGITPNWLNGLPMTANNLFLPFPGDSNKYVLIHHTATFDGYSYPAYELFYSIIYLSLNGGLGGVIF